MVTGDYPAHDIWLQSREYNMNTAKVMIDLVKKYFPDKKIIPSLGNHDSFPCNRYFRLVRHTFLMISNTFHMSVLLRVKSKIQTFNRIGSTPSWPSCTATGFRTRPENRLRSTAFTLTYWAQVSGLSSSTQTATLAITCEWWLAQRSHQIFAIRISNLHWRQSMLCYVIDF